MDEVALYNRSLTADEVEQHYLNSEYYDNNYCNAYNAEYGNGIIDVGEGCDDDNTNNGDGCSACSIDSGYSCSGIPSICIPDADGDGVEDSVDGCDNALAPAGMTTYWALKEGSGSTTADSYNSNPGMLVNSPAWYIGKVGYGLNFTTGSSQKVTTGYDLNETSGSWTLWVAPNKINQQGSAIGTANDNFRILFYNTNKIYFRAGAVNTPSTGYDISNWTVGEWHHLAMAWNGNGNTFYAYIDGEQVASDTQNYYGGDNIALGGTTLYFKGIIDEAAVYDKQLSAEEVSQAYNNTLQGYGYCTA
jgi:cysteine-rich repeat protein